MVLTIKPCFRVTDVSIQMKRSLPQMNCISSVIALAQSINACSQLSYL